MEPEKPIEELLKASAGKRREEFGPDVSMPNPMRVRLQEEIASLNRPDEKPRSWFAWPRLVLATAAVALLVALPLAWQWRQTSGSRTLSDARFSREAAGGNSEPAGREVADAAKQSAATAAAPNVAESSAARAPAAALAMKTRNVSQRFAQSPAQQNVEQSLASGVLNNFQLEQDGENVRVVDADGSTYTGRMEKLARNDGRALAYKKKADVARAKAAAPANRKSEKEEASNEYHFQASGYNVQLKKPLSFEGNYIAELPSANETQSKDGMSANQARVFGTARVEGEPPVEVDAKAVPP